MIGRSLALYDLKNEVDILTDSPNLKIVLFGIDYWNFGNHLKIISLPNRP